MCPLSFRPTKEGDALYKVKGDGLLETIRPPYEINVPQNGRVRLAAGPSGAIVKKDLSTAPDIVSPYTELGGGLIQNKSGDHDLDGQGEYSSETSGVTYQGEKSLSEFESDTQSWFDSLQDNNPSENP